MLTATCYLGRTYIVCTARNVFMFIRWSRLIRVVNLMWLYTLPAMVYQSDCSVVSRFHLTLYSAQMYDAVRIVSGPREGVSSLVARGDPL